MLINNIKIVKNNSTQGILINLQAIGMFLKRPPVCVNTNPDTTQLPIGIADHGTPINALEVDPIGRILTTEEKVKYTNVGSILPKFTYTEQ